MDPSQQGPPQSFGFKFAYASPGQMIAAGAALPAVGILIVFLRFYTRASKKVRLGIDDYLILPALLLVIGMGCAIIAGVKENAVAYPTPPPPMGANPLTNINHKTTIVQKVQFITQLFMVAAYGLIKLSVIYFYRRVFNVNKSQWFNTVTNICLATIGIWTVAYIFSIAFDCGTHWSAHWTSIMNIIQYCGGGHTVQQVFQSLLYSDLITDVLILLLPVPKIWTLQLTPAKKWAVMGIFLLGGIATGAAAARIYIYTAESNRSLDPTLDENLSVSTVIYWSMIEAGLSLIAACLPTTQHIFRGHSLGSVVNSVRSAISLPSITRSQNSGGSRNRTTIHQGDTTGSFKKLTESGSLADQNSGPVQDLPASSLEDRHNGKMTGVNKTVSIEMTSHEGTMQPSIGDEAWRRA